MKKITVESRKLYEAVEPAVKPAPTTKPAEPTTKPGISPTRPPRPATEPAPKNKKQTFLSTLSNLMNRFNKLGGKINEAEDPDTGLDPKLNATVKAGTGDNLQAATQATFDVKEIATELAELEQNLHQKEALEAACEEIIREIFGKYDERFNISDVDFDLEIKYKDNVDQGSADKLSNNKLGADPSAVQKRRIANFISQGFAFNSFEKMFDENPSKIIAFIDTQIIQLYYRYFERMNAANANAPISIIKQMMELLKRLSQMGSESDFQTALSQAGMVQASVKVEYGEDGKVTIKAVAGNFITLFHEAVKGVFELVSHWGLAGHNEEELKKIYAETEGWVEEYRAFKYGGNVVKAFVEFLGKIATEVDGKSEVDYVVYPAVLAWLYRSDNVPDREFVAFMERVIMGKPSQEDVALGIKAYNAAHGIESKDVGVEAVADSPDAKVAKMSLDDLLDKVSAGGVESLTKAEKDRLDKLTNEEFSFGTYIAMLENQRMAEFISRKIKKLRKEGKGEKQALAIALSYARREGILKESWSGIEFSDADMTAQVPKSSISAKELYDMLQKANTTFTMNPSQTVKDCLEVSAFTEEDYESIKKRLTGFLYSGKEAA